MPNFVKDSRRRQQYGVDARIAADYLIDLGIQEKMPKTPLQIMKLLFFAHVLRLAAYGRPLSRTPFEAWKFGPVVRDVYHELKHHGRDEIDMHIFAHNEVRDELNNEQRSVLDQTYKDFGKIDGISLSHMTHWPDNPWSIAKKRGDGSLLSDTEIEEYYKEYLTRSD